MPDPDIASPYWDREVVKPDQPSGISSAPPGVCDGLAKIVGGHTYANAAKPDGQDGDGLLPCPFCGSAPKCNGQPGGVMGQIYCANSDCFGPKTTASWQQESVKQWNTRASSQPTRNAAEGAGETYGEALAKVNDRFGFMSPRSHRAAEDVGVDPHDLFNSLRQWQFDPKVERLTRKICGDAADEIERLRKPATPQPAPDAVREATLAGMRDAITLAAVIADPWPDSSDDLTEVDQAVVAVRKKIAAAIRAIVNSTTVPSPAPSGEAKNLDMLAAAYRQHGGKLFSGFTVANSLESQAVHIRSRPPSATGAAEPEILDTFGWLLDAIKSEGVTPTPLLKRRFEKAEEALLRAVAIPSVRGDRELLEQCTKLARQFELDMSGSQLDDRDIESIQHGANVASNAIADAILSLLIQPSTEEQK